MSYKHRATDNPTIHRTIGIGWRPRSRAEWATFTASRLEAAALWNRMARIHAFCRRRRRAWPTKQQFRDWASKKRGHFPNLNSQSVQVLVDDFLEAVKSARVQRKNGNRRARYPKAKGRYRDVPYKNNQARVRDGEVILPNAGAGTLKIRLPSGITGEQIGPSDALVTMAGKYQGRLMEATLAFGELRLAIAVETSEGEAAALNPAIGVDLGVNTLIAATDGETALLISGRGIKSLVRYRNKKLGEIQRKQSRRRRDSRKRRKLQRAKRRMLARNKRQVRDLIHKATRKVADAFPGATCFVGRPFNDAARKVGRRQAQTVSSACNRIIIQQLGYKLARVEEVDEYYTSQTCPACGERRKCRRTYRCACGFSAHRDVVGGLHHRSLGLSGELAAGATAPSQIKYARPGATRGCARAGIHSLPRPLGDEVDVRVEAASSSSLRGGLAPPVVSCDTLRFAEP